MTKILEVIQTEHGIEHSLLKYEKPKIYHGGPSMDLKKRWYVYYKHLNPDTGAMIRQDNIYSDINRRFKTKRERLREFNLLRNAVEQALKDGFSPYEDKTDTSYITIRNAFEYALKVKEASVSDTTFKDYSIRINAFLKHLDKTSVADYDIENFNKQIVNQYLNHLASKTSASNRNNTRRVLSTIMRVLKKEDYIKENFIDDIDVLNHKAERNRTYTLNTVDEIYEKLEKTDPIMLLFIKFVSYNFLRPIEVVRLKVSDIDIINKSLYVRAKNKPVKIKIIPDLLLDEIIKLRILSQKHFLFTPDGIGYWKNPDITDEQKRNHFSKRYSVFKKDFGISKDYGLYSFRHTFITKLYRELRNEHSITETIDILMLITGHSSKQALYKYLRDIDAELPNDYSHLLK